MAGTKRTPRSPRQSGVHMENIGHPAMSRERTIGKAVVPGRIPSPGGIVRPVKGAKAKPRKSTS